jgi:hypothetical protein
VHVTKGHRAEEDDTGPEWRARPKGVKSLRRHRRRCWNIIKGDLNEILFQGVCCIHVTVDRPVANSCDIENELPDSVTGDCATVRLCDCQFLKNCAAVIGTGMLGQFAPHFALAIGPQTLVS